MPEVAFNLWWFYDQETELVIRLAGRAYGLAGSDAEKLAVLRSLATTDFHVAPVFQIPKRFKVVSGTRTIEGVADPQFVRQFHADLFEHVFAALEKDLPVQVRSVNGEYQQYRLPVPRDPLCVTTCVIDCGDGTFTPLVSGSP